MPWKEQFNRLKGEWTDLLGGRTQQGPQQGYSNSQMQYPGQFNQQYQQQQQYYPQQQQQQQYSGYPAAQPQFPGYPVPQAVQPQYPGYPPPQQQYPGYPPPQQPFSGYPPAAPAPTPTPVQTYNSIPTQSRISWQPRFHPDQPVGQEWDAKQGNNNGWGNAELQHYTSRPENVFFTPDNKLVIRAISRPSHPDAAQKYTSARLVSRPTLSRPSGSLITNISLPCAPGIWPAFWLLPREPFTWPHDGEVDIAETWNGDGINRSCVHWGFFTGEDATKHRSIETAVQGMPTRPVKFEFAWIEAQHAGSGSGGEKPGRMMFWIDDRAVMKAYIPTGIRAMSDFQIVINIAMGGNVCQGRTPAEGSYDFVVHEIKICEEPQVEGNSGGMANGWERFERDWRTTPEGRTM